MANPSIRGAVSSSLSLRDWTRWCTWVMGQRLGRHGLPDQERAHRATWHLRRRGVRAGFGPPPPAGWSASAAGAARDARAQRCLKQHLRSVVAVVRRGGAQAALRFSGQQSHQYVDTVTGSAMLHRVAAYLGRTTLGNSSQTRPSCGWRASSCAGCVHPRACSRAHARNRKRTGAQAHMRAVAWACVASSDTQKDYECLGFQPPPECTSAWEDADATAAAAIPTTVPR